MECVGFSPGTEAASSASRVLDVRPEQQSDGRPQLGERERLIQERVGTRGAGAFSDPERTVAADHQDRNASGVGVAANALDEFETVDAR